MVTGSYFLAWSAQWLLEDFPKVRLYLGLPKSPAMDWSGVPGVARLRLRPRSAGAGKEERKRLEGVLDP